VKQILGTVVVLGLVMVGCSSLPAAPGQPTASQPTADQPTENVPSATPPAGAAPTTAAPVDGLGFGKAGNSAVVKIGDQTYEFENLYCVTLAGAIGAQSVSGDPHVNIDLPPMNWQTSGEGWEPPAVSVDGDDPYFDLTAGAAVSDSRLVGKSQVDSFDSDGKHATGTATFIDITAFMLDQSTPTVSGTFEVTCAAS
jgi:hypothetical protein